MQIRPFVINSNLATTKKDVATLDSFFDSVAGNVGNSYITYALLKECGIPLQNLQHIQSVYTYGNL